MGNKVFELHAVCKGNVQGVGFRYVTQRFARELNLAGTVKNLADGSVEIFAQGPKEALELLLFKLQNDAFRKEIEKIDIQFYAPTLPRTDFVILRS